MTTTTTAQDLLKHQWKDRVILLISNDESADILEEQIKVLNTSTDGLKERKIVVYRIHRKRYKSIFPTESTWINDSDTYSHFNVKNENFKIILIGLDGSTKLSQSKILNLAELWAKIDSMPMRKKEIKQQK